MEDTSKVWFAIVKTDNRGKETVAKTVRGLDYAQQVVLALNSNLTEEEKQSGLWYYHQETSTPPAYVRPREPRNFETVARTVIKTLHP